LDPRFSDHLLSAEKKESLKRRAIIIGVNKYDSSSDIPTLAGAENDAREIYEQFKNNGNFEISNNHLLLGPDATRRKILKAVSEIFRRDMECALVAFYFSGHGIVDKNNEGYIAPYDMDPEDPYISGINMEDLRDVISKSENKASVIIFLDCCYAGIATKDGTTKSTTLTDNPNTKNLYATQLQKMVESADQTNTLSTGRGKIILASSEANEVSRERNNCTHLGKEEPHTHGAFTFHLIEGLDGKAANPDTGVITIEGLRRHIENQMMAEKRQRPMYYVAEASRIDNIKIAISLNQFNTKIAQTIKAADNLCSIKYQDSDLIDIQCLAGAAKKVGELISLDPNNKEVTRLQNIIDDAVKAYLQPTINWLNRNIGFARLKINEIEQGLYDRKLPNLIQSLSFSELQKIDQIKLDSLIHLSAEVANNTEFKSEDDPQLMIFQSKLLASFRNTLGAKQ
jgi:hypothetical protein